MSDKKHLPLCVTKEALCPGGTSDKEQPASAGDVRDMGLIGSDPWVGKLPRRRAWQSTPVLLSGESHGQRRLVGCNP